MSINAASSFSSRPADSARLYLVKNESDSGPGRATCAPVQGNPGDSVAISDQSRLFQQVKQMVHSQPDVRIGRTNQLAGEIDKGTYHIPSKTVADAVIRKHLIDVSA
jgi:flagellar biosynthesis anti-sigma factor FlgM